MVQCANNTVFTRPSFFCSVSFGLPLLWTHPSNLSRSDNFTLSLIHIKPWQNGLASHRRCSTCVHLAFCLATHLRGLAFTLVDLKLIRTQKFFTIWPPNANRHKLIASHLYMRQIDFFATSCVTYEPACYCVWSRKSE